MLEVLEARGIQWSWSTPAASSRFPGARALSLRCPHVDHGGGRSRNRTGDELRQEFGNEDER